VIVVSNTSPLNYLILIRAVELLPRLFGRVVIPRIVADELSDPRTPDVVRAWIKGSPAWLDVLVPKTPDSEIRLHPGERDALSLALELKADLVLVDDLAARRVAKERGLTVTGTLGVLDLAAKLGLLDLPKAVEALRQTSYQIREDVLEALLEEHRQRSGKEDDTPGPDTEN
jgi:predicted nucleic acid-binding protein